MYLLIAILIIIYFVAKENREDKKMPPNAYFDWDEYYEDIRNGMSCTEQLRKEQNYGYYKSRDTQQPKK
jgi:hypothetical protein